VSDFIEIEYKPGQRGIVHRRDFKPGVHRLWADRDRSVPEAAPAGFVDQSAAVLTDQPDVVTVTERPASQAVDLAASIARAVGAEKIDPPASGNQIDAYDRSAPIKRRGK